MHVQIDMIILRCVGSPAGLQRGVQEGYRCLYMVDIGLRDEIEQLDAPEI
jgi:hypothetical protein